MSGSNGHLTRDSFLAKGRELLREEVQTPIGPVFVQSMTEGQKADFELWMRSETGGVKDLAKRQVRMRLCVDCLVDEQGEQLLEDHDIEALENFSPSVIGPISDVAWRLSGFDEDDAEEIKETAKN